MSTPSPNTVAQIDSAFTFLGEPESRRSQEALFIKVLNFEEFARKYFQDKSPASSRYLRGALPGPLLKQIWGDGDSERVLTVWATLLRFIGDLPPNPKKVLTTLQSAQLITNIGITRINTRDEIFCQLCKQLTANPNKASFARGWILLALCCGIFHPSSNMIGGYCLRVIEKYW